MSMLVMGPCTRAWLPVAGWVRSGMVVFALDAVTLTVTRICS
jgi:hypothetical protein